MNLKIIDRDSRTDIFGRSLKIALADKEILEEIVSLAQGTLSDALSKWKNHDYLQTLSRIADMNTTCDECCFTKMFSYEELDKFADELILNDEPIPDGYAPEGGYSENDFGCELKRRVFRKDSIESLAKWALEIFIEMDYASINGMRDWDFRNALLNLAAMTEGKEFEMSYKELDKLADDMILGRDIELK